jgi:DNA topoisomerase I
MATSQAKAPAKKDKTLVIVESPAKAKTISKFLGKNYFVKASNGHIRDLPKSKMGIEIEDNFEPQYINIRGKGDLIKGLKTEANKATKVYLATDPDREGEAISWHIANILGIDEKSVCRIEFNEITKTAIKAAIDEPRQIDMDLVNAQQARRLLDRIVGYKISPILWFKVKRGLSAGRVQSVAVRIICDREEEIRNFVPVEFWTIGVELLTPEGKVFEAKFYGKDGKKLELDNEEEANRVLEAIKKDDFIIKSIKETIKKRRPSAPFSTSTLQQDASRKLRFSTRKTMVIAQQLYEGVDIKGYGTTGLVTYIRTDTTRVSNEAINSVRETILERYGKEYLPEKPNVYKAKKNAQDAHEAIRPSQLELMPDKIKAELTNDQFKLYTLIYNRFVSSQMMPAQFDSISADIVSGGYTFRANGQRLRFKGFLAVYKNYGENEAEDKNSLLPPIKKDDVCKLKKANPKQNFTQPPARYNEASLVRALEEKGIGRPSTYSPIISTIIDRKYVEREDRSLKPTFLGEAVTNLLKKHFTDIVNIAFTAEMEDKLDNIENGDKNWKDLLADFYGPFEKLLDKSNEIERVELPVIVTDEICEKCGANMVIKEGRFGEFLACPNYPECKNAKPIVKYIDTPCPKCSHRVVEKKSNKTKKIFYGCEKYPACDFVSWDMPLDEKCEECSSYMVLKKRAKGNDYKKCSNSECKTNEKKKKDE